MEQASSEYLAEQAAAFRRLADTMTGPLNAAALNKLAADCEHHAESVRRHALTLVAFEEFDEGHFSSHEQILEWAEQKKAERRHEPTP